MNPWNKVEKFSDDKEHVTKFVFTKKDAVVETVLYRYPTYQERTVICCSVMSGCPMGCRFCGTGDYFVRNLTAEEIVEQVTYAITSTDENPSDIKKLQIMFMSMGEPMLNMKEVCSAIRTLNELYPNAFLLVSTSAPAVNYKPFIDLSVEIDKVGLQFSVHEIYQEKRDELIPFKAKLSLTEIYETGLSWFIATGRKPFFNYCAHETNSSDDHAGWVRCKFHPDVFNATVSVICERNDGMPTSNEFQKQLAVDFSAKLVERGFDVRVFDPAGQDTIGGGCGQLWYVQQWMKDHPEKTRKSIGHGKSEVHVPVAKMLT